MSNLSIATAAALLIASIAPVEAYAQSGGYLVPARPFHTQSKRLKARVPTNVKGSAIGSGSFPTPALNYAAGWFETNPDPRIRFEMKEIPRHTRPAPLANETRRIAIDDCVHALLPECGSGP
jgi:hypothetical protein